MKKESTSNIRHWLGIPEGPEAMLRPPTTRDMLWTLIPGGLWGLGVWSRTFLLRPYCQATPTPCRVELLWPVDQLSAGLEMGLADGLSFASQNISGALSIGGLLLLHAILIFQNRNKIKIALTRFYEDFLILAQTVFWNGTFTEISHILTSRPRPFVLKDTAGLGLDPAHYTSFYSGHTSFAGASMSALFLLTLRRRLPWGFVVAAAVLAQALMMMTGIFRVFAGRHYITDVVAGGIAGGLVAWIVALKYCSSHRVAKVT